MQTGLIGLIIGHLLANYWLIRYLSINYCGGLVNVVVGSGFNFGFWVL
jgi:hypothetical protein